MAKTKTRAVPWVPHDYQYKAINFTVAALCKHGGAGLFLDPGLGKTSTTLSVFLNLKQAGLANTMLIVAPLRVAQTVWPAEITKWLEFSHLTYVLIHGNPDIRLAAIKKKADIYIINYEGLLWLTEQQWFGADVLCFDELSKMKSWSSARVKAFKPFLPTFKFRIGLTGTPASNGLEDLFSQIFMLDIGKRLGYGITKFRSQYFKPRSVYDPSAKPEPLPTAVFDVYEKIKDIVFRLDAGKHLGLPEEITNIIKLQLPPKQRTMYKQLVKDMLLELESGTIVSAVSAAVLTNKLRQFLSGNMYSEHREVHHVHSIKLEALKEFIECQQGQPVLVGYQYQHEAAAFKEAFKGAVFINSSTTTAQLIQIVKDFNAGKIPLLFGHPASVGHGLNLQAGCNAVLFYSLDFNLENHLQFIKRVARQGQKKPYVVTHYLLFDSTIEEYILSVLMGKAELQTTLLTYLSQED